MRPSAKMQMAADALGRGSSPAWVRAVTEPLSHLFGALSGFRGRLFDAGLKRQRRLPGKTVSIGNLVAGGTGKSPMTILIAKELQARGFKPAILTRGYGSTLSKDESLALVGGNVVMTSRTNAAANDEARMQSVALPAVPVVVGQQRFAAATRFMREQPMHLPTHWLLDDGFQHRQLARDFDIVLLDAQKPLGNGRLLPRGPLREAVDALKRASLVIFTRASEQTPDAAHLADVRRVYAGEMLKAKFVAGPLECMTGVTAFDPQRHGPVLLVSGVARPERFLEQVRGVGVKVKEVYMVADHRAFASEELKRRASGALSVVTTAKDYWRDPSVFANLAIPVFVQELCVDMDIDALFALMSEPLALHS